MLGYFSTFLLFILPFIILPFGTSQYEIPKVAIAEIAIEIFLIFFIMRTKLPKIKFDKRFLFLLAGVLLLTFVDLIFFRTPTSFFGNPFRLQGIFLLWHLIIFSFISSLVFIKEVKSSWLVLFLISQLILSIISGVTSDGRIVGSIGEPNALASYSVFIFPFILFGSKKENILLKIIAAGLVLIILFLTGSRSGAIAFAIELIIYFLIQIKHISINKVFIISIFLALLSLGLPFLDKISPIEDRKEIWRISISAALKEPLFGYGFGNLEKVIHNEGVALNSPMQYLSIDSTHNFLLDWWIEVGITGLIIIVSLVSLALYNLTHKNQLKYFVAFLGLVTTMLFNPSSVVNLLAFWWLIGTSFN